MKTKRHTYRNAAHVQRDHVQHALVSVHAYDSPRGHRIYALVHYARVRLILVDIVTKKLPQPFVAVAYDMQFILSHYTLAFCTVVAYPVLDRPIVVINVHGGPFDGSIHAATDFAFIHHSLTSPVSWLARDRSFLAGLTVDGVISWPTTEAVTIPRRAASHSGVPCTRSSNILRLISFSKSCGLWWRQCLLRSLSSSLVLLEWGAADIDFAQHIGLRSFNF